MATQNIISSVSMLDVASQSVKLLAKSVEEGITNGNNVEPASKMIAVILTALKVNPHPAFPYFAKRLTSSGKITVPAANSHKAGRVVKLPNQFSVRATSLLSGFELAPEITSEVIF